MEILDTTIRGRKDIEDKLSIPFLGDIPEYHGSTRQGSVVVRDNGRDSVSEAFRLIRSNLGFMSVKSGKLQIIMVTSSNPHAGKTFVTTNLAMTLALADKKVVIVDLDLRRRTLSKQKDQREYILRERQIELNFEGDRYYTTRRRLLSETVAKARTDKYGDAGSVWGLSVRGGDPKTNNFKSTEFYEPVAFEQRVFKKAYYLFPIPQSETDKSPALVQNPGW